jgi:hypothetical protein
MKLIKETKLYFIHDFQQLLTGIMLGPSAPTILRWHIPFRLEGATQSLKLLVTKGVEAFDAVIVSTRLDIAAELTNFTPTWIRRDGVLLRRVLCKRRKTRSA